MTPENLKGVGNVRYWQYLTGKEFEEIDKSKAVVMVTCSPIEVHGPHLPVVTDNFEAEGITKRTVELVGAKHPEILFLRLPTIYVAADVLPHTGSLMFRSSTIVRVLSDLGRTLAKQGFKNIWVSSFHGGPRHFVAIEQAAHKTNKKYGARMVSLFSLLINRLTQGTPQLSNILGHIKGLSPEVLDGDTHGGVIETSLMLYLLRDCVDPCFKECKRITVDLKLAAEGKPPAAHKPGRASIPQLLRGFKASLKYFETETYAGKPDISTPEIGKEILDTLAGHCAEALSQLWSGQLPLEKCHSPVWPLRHIFLWRWVSVIFERAVGYKNPIF